MTDTTNFIILTTQRSGSVFLEQCLNSHHSVRCFGEILLGIGGLSGIEAPKFLNRFRRPRLFWTYVLSGAAFRPQSVIKDAFSRGGEDRSVVGFRCMYNQLRSGTTVDFLVKQRDLKIIHLRRTNLLLQYISRQQMHRRQSTLGKGSAHTTQEIHVDRVHISPRKAINAMRRIVSDGERFDSLFKNHQKLNLNYEDIIADGSLKPAVRDSLCTLLGIEATTMFSVLKKMNRHTLEECLLNFDEMREAIEKTEFCSLLPNPAED